MNAWTVVEPERPKHTTKPYAVRSPHGLTSDARFRTRELAEKYAERLASDPDAETRLETS